jgi:HYDIN/CFA65/VesB family protein/ASPM-SPD-2-Hydin domain-containing protein
MRINRLLFWLLFLSSGTQFLAGQSADSIPPRSPKAAVRQVAQQNIVSGLKTSASSLSFGNEQLSSASAPQFITITNGGKSDLALTEVASSELDFRLAHNCALTPDIMPAGSSCAISIRFVPGAVGLRRGNIRIAIGGDPPMQPLIIALQGDGVDSPVTLSQTYLVFRTVLVGMTSMPQFVRLTNHSSTAPAKITSIAASPDFSFAATTSQCITGSTLAPLASCTVAMVWTPSDSGSRSGQVTIADSDPASPHIIDLQASATGIRLSSGTLRWNPAAVGVTGVSQIMEVKNEGGTAIKIESVEASGDFYQQNTCGKELVQHQSCAVTVWFQPTAAGERVGTVLIHDSDVTGMQQIFLTGVGSPLDLSPVKMDFGNQVAESTSAPQTVTITNRGGANVKIAAINVSGDFVIPGKTCGDTVVAGKSCQLSVSFSPTMSGVRTGALSIETDVKAAPQKVTLSGKGR